MLAFSYFFNGPPPTEIDTLSLHDALPIFYQFVNASSALGAGFGVVSFVAGWIVARHFGRPVGTSEDRKSTRLNSSHLGISYAVFCLKKTKAKLIRNSLISQDAHARSI